MGLSPEFRRQAQNYLEAVEAPLPGITDECMTNGLFGQSNGPDMDKPIGETALDGLLEKNFSGMGSYATCDTSDTFDTRGYVGGIH